MNRLYEATWGRAFAALYDRGLKATEENGLRDMRRELLASARGRTLDLGAGTGANVGLYPEAVSELVLAEPSPHMARRLRRRVAEAGVEAEVIEEPAQDLPFEDSSFDTAVFTLVLCTVPEPGPTLREVRRVLRADGVLLFLEHVRSDEPGTARWQDRLERPWRFLADGCHPNRDTLANLERAGFAVAELDRDRIPKAPPIVRPLIRGAASPR